MAFRLSNVKLWLTLALFVSVLLNVHAQDGYVSDSVVFRSKADTIRIGATITKPRNGKKMPAVVLVSGTGKQDREGTMGKHKWFAVIADHLSRKGFVVLRMDDRGVGETSGNYALSTTYDFAMDALQAVDYLKSYPGVDPKKIGMLGHSEGGAAISIAASISQDVRFLISLSGLAMNGLDALITQNEALVRESPMKERDKIRSNEINGLMFKTAYQYADSANMEQALNETYNNWKERDKAYFGTLGEQFDHFRFPIWSYVQQATGPWYRFFVRYNAAMYLSHVHIPILAINGERDNMVVPQNLQWWKRYAGRGQGNNVTTVLLSRLNHLLQPVPLAGDKKEGLSEQVSIAPEVLEIVTDWLMDLYG